MKRYIFLILAIGLFFLLLLPLILQKAGFFVLEKQVPSRNLIIEAWVNPIALDQPPFSYDDYDTIFIVGIKNEDNWDDLIRLKNEIHSENRGNDFWIPTKGFLFLRNIPVKNLNDTISRIRVIARGTKANDRFAHFYLSVRDSVLGQTFVNEESDTFDFKVNLTRNQLDNLNIYFSNDLLTETEDINLVVNEIIVNDISFYASGNDFALVPANFNGYKFSLMKSNAAETGAYLKASKNIKSEVFVIDTLFTKKNKTLAAAKAFNQFLKDRNIKIASANIYTLSFHSRRTNLAYRKVLNSNIKIGSIVKHCPECLSSRKESFKSRYWGACDEFISWMGTLVAF